MSSIPGEVLALAANDRALREAAASVSTGEAAGSDTKRVAVDLGAGAARDVAIAGALAAAAAEAPKVQVAAEVLIKEVVASPEVQQVKGDREAKPATGSVMQQVMASPRIQEAAWSVGAAAASEVASAGVALARSDMLEVKTYIQENRGSVKALCFCAALALLVFSVMGVLSIFQAVFHPFQYLLAIYNVLFALAIVVMDGKPEWYARRFDAQRRLFRAAPILASQAGRGCFYLYVGSLNLAILPDSLFWKIAYIVIGAALCFAGLFMLADACRRRRSDSKAARAVSGNVQPV